MTEMTRAYLFLLAAIVFEVIGTSALRATEGFSRWAPSLLVVLGYSASFYCLSLTLEKIPVGVAYAIWSGAGTALIVAAAAVIYRQKPDLAGLLGIALIIAGVVVLNGFSKMTVH